MFFPYADKEQALFSMIDRVTGQLANSFLCFPIVGKSEGLMGVLQITCLKGDVEVRLKAQDLQSAELVSKQCALVWDYERMVEQVGRLKEDNMRQSLHYKHLREIGRVLSEQNEIAPSVQKILASIQKLVQADRMTLFLTDNERGEMYAFSAVNTNDGNAGNFGNGVQSIRVKLNQGLAGYVAG